MKKTIKIVAFILFVFFTSITFAQQEENTYWKQKEMGIISNSLNLAQKTSSINQVATIQQIGNYNTNVLTIKASTSNFSVIQNGDFNAVDVTKYANSLTEYIIQNGNNNFISEYAIYSNNVDSQVTQTGNNNNYLSYGSNSISDNLKINIKGNDKTVIVLSR